MSFKNEEETEKIVEFIKNYYKENNLKGAVIGISGGKDSAVVAGLMCRAIGSENVLGVTLPCHSNELDKIHAKLISDYFGFSLINIDLTNTFDTLKSEILKLNNYTEEELKNSDINLKPRLRMSACYYISALYTNIKKAPYIVIGTSNKCEIYVGYFTKGGDSVHDINPIGDLTVSEVIKIGEVLGVPREILYKAPSDGISGITDEEKLGVSYKEIEMYLINPNNVEEKTKNKIEKLHKNNLHKYNIPTYKKLKSDN